MRRYLHRRLQRDLVLVELGDGGSHIDVFEVRHETFVKRRGRFLLIYYVVEVIIGESVRGSLIVQIFARRLGRLDLGGQEVGLGRIDGLAAAGRWGRY